MAILTVKYSTPDNDSLIVTHDDSTPAWNVPWPCYTHHNVIIQVWLSVPNTITPADAIDPMIEVRAARDAMVAACDWLYIRHNAQIDNSESPALSSADYTVLLVYMKDLRDIPALQPTVDINTVAWPTKPSFM